MYKPKVEFYNYYISFLPWPTDLNVYCSNLEINAYVTDNFERHSIKMTKKLQNAVFFLFRLSVTLTFDLPTQKCNYLMNMLLSISHPSVEEIRWKMTENWRMRVVGKKKNKK